MESACTDSFHLFIHYAAENIQRELQAISKPEKKPLPSIV
jgi:hypothetical protein